MSWLASPGYLGNGLLAQRGVRGRRLVSPHPAREDLPLEAISDWRAHSNDPTEHLSGLPSIRDPPIQHSWCLVETAPPATIPRYNERQNILLLE